MSHSSQSICSLACLLVFLLAYLSTCPLTRALVRCLSPELLCHSFARRAVCLYIHLLSRPALFHRVLHLALGTLFNKLLLYTRNFGEIHGQVR